MPTYAAAGGVPYHLPTATQPRAATPTAVPTIGPVIAEQPAESPLSGMMAAGGLVLISVACALLVVDRKPEAGRADQDGVL